MKSRFSSALAILFLLISCAGEIAPPTAQQLAITDNGDGTFNYGKLKLKKDENGGFYIDNASKAPQAKSVNGVTILTPAEAKKLKEKHAGHTGLKRAPEKAVKTKKNREKSINVVEAQATPKTPEQEAGEKVDPLEEFRKNNPQLYNQEREAARQRARAKIKADAENVESYKTNSTVNNAPFPILPPQYLELKERARDRDNGDNGDSESQYQLGVALKNGLGGERDVEKARYWLEKAAAQGHVKAKLVLNGRW